MSAPSKACLLLLGLCGLTAAAPRPFAADLDPAPFDASDRALLIGGGGRVTATLTGATLAIAGRFEGLGCDADAGAVRIGLAKGVPGAAIAPLRVTAGRSGDISGSVRLTGRQVAALRAAALYVRIDCRGVADGNLQGWLEPR
jgi:hypothetical protein